MLNYISLICLIFIFAAILMEANFFYNNLNKIDIVSLPKSESENQIVIKKPVSKSNPFIPPNAYYSPPTGCPGLGC